MKKFFIVLFAVALMLPFAACDEDPTIVGKWQLNSSSDPNYPGDRIIKFEFNENQTGLEFYTENGVTDTAEIVWVMSKDTIFVLDANNNYSEHIGMPVPYIVEDLNKNNMTWLALLGGSFRIYFNRL